MALRAQAERLEVQKETGAPPLATDDDDLPMPRLARLLGLRRDQTELLWTIVACSIDGRLLIHLEPIGGPHIRRGLGLALYSLLIGEDDVSMAVLAQWLSAPNLLVEAGLLETSDDGSSATRGYVASSRLISYLAGDDVVTPPLRIGLPPECPLHDREQASTVAALAEVLRTGRQAVVAVDGARGSGRVSAVACAAGESVLVLDIARVAPSQLPRALRALRGECLLRDELVVLANVDHTMGDDANERRRLLGDAIDAIPGCVIVTTALAGTDLGTTKPIVRFGWALATRMYERRCGDARCNLPGERSMEIYGTSRIGIRSGPGQSSAP